MSRKMLTHLDMVKNELQNAVAQNLAGAPSSPVKGQFYFNSTDNILYWWNGTSWVSAAGGGTGFPGYGAVVAEPTFGSASADGVAATVSRNDHKHGNPAHDAAAHATIPLNALAAATANYAMGGFKITGLPTAGPWSASDAASKAYVDSVASGLDPKPSARAATTANITLSGQQTIDGQALVDGDICLVKNQTTPAQNGLYWVSVTTWTRLNEMDSWGEVISAFCFVEQGSTQADTGWVCTSDVGGTIGSTAINWVQFSGAGVITAGAGMTQAGNTLNVVAADASLTVAADSVAVAFGGTGSAVTAAKSDHTHTAPPTLKYAVDVGGGTSQVVTHNLNTLDVGVTVYRKAGPNDEVHCDVEHTSVNTVTLRFNVAPSAAEYRAVVFA